MATLVQEVQFRFFSSYIFSSYSLANVANRCRKKKRTKKTSKFKSILFRDVETTAFEVFPRETDAKYDWRKNPTKKDAWATKGKIYHRDEVTRR